MVQVISIVITCLAGLFGLIGLFVGFARRTYRSLIRMGTVILAAVIAALITSPIASAVYGGVGDTVREALMSAFGESFSVLAQSEALSSLVAALPSVIISVVLFVPLFIVLSLLMLIPYGIICHYVLDKKQQKSAMRNETPVEIVTDHAQDKKQKKSDFPYDRPVGMAVGAVTGLLICSFILAPFCGALGVAKDVAGLFPDDAEFTPVVEALDTVGNHWFVKATNLYSGLLLGSVAKAKVAGVSVNFAEELALLSSLTEEAYSVFGDGNPTTGEVLSVLPDILDKVVKSDLLCALAADIISDASDAWKNGEAYMEIEKPELNGSAAQLFDKIVELLAESSPETIREDLKTISELAVVLNNHGVSAMIATDGQEQTFDFASLVKDEALMPDLMNPVLANDRMKALLPSVINIGLSALGESLALPSSDAQLYDTMTQALADKLNEKPTQKEFTAFTKEAFADSGAVINDRVTEILAEGLYEEFKKTSTVSAQNVATFLNEVLSDRSVCADEPAFLFVSASNITKIRERIAQLDEVTLEGCEALKSNITFKSTKITVEKIRINDDTLFSLSDEELRQEVTLLSSAVNSAIKFVETVRAFNPDTGITVANLDMKELGRAVDELMSSKLLGETAENMIDGVLESEYIESIIPNAKETLGSTLLDGVKDGTLRFETVLEASQKSAALVAAVQDKTLTEDEKEKEIEANVTWLLENMSQDTANAIKNVITVDLLQSFGLEEKPAQSVSTVIGELLNELTSSSALGKDEYAKESKAIKELLSVAVNGTEITEKEVYRTLFDSKIVTTAAKRSVDKLDSDPFDMTKNKKGKDLSTYKANVKTQLKDIFDDLYADTADKTSFRESLLALGKLMGVDLTNDINSWAD